MVQHTRTGQGGARHVPEGLAEELAPKGQRRTLTSVARALISALSSWTTPRSFVRCDVSLLYTATAAT